MKYLKYFENNQNKYKIGDFVIGNVNWTETNNEYTINDVNNYLNNNAGKIIDMEIDGNENDFIYLRYINLPMPMFEFCEDAIDFTPNQIIRYATKKEIETFKMKENADKFNL